VEVPQVRKQPHDHGADRAIVLEDDEQERHEVQDGQSKDYPPDGGVRAREGPVGEGERGQDEEEEDYAREARPRVPLSAQAVVSV
jgi:hypothetical protein